MFFAIVFLFLPFMVLGTDDIPCNKVRAQYGYICVCNSTYCDTINPPKKLSNGEFHFYSTSHENPGFNYKKGNFRMQAFSPEGFKYSVNKTSRFQKIRGFGGSFTDSFGFVLNDLSDDTREKLMRSFFAEDGIEYTTCRVVIGSSDFSLRGYTYLPNYDPSLKSFNLTEDDFIYKIRYMKKAINMSRHHINFLGSSWNAPDWMKRKSSFKTDYLKPEFRQLWADYFVKTLDSFRSEGIEFWALTTGNEPITLYSIPVGDILIMFPEEQREWIVNNIGPALDKANYTTKIIVLDDMRWFAVWWMNSIMRDKRSEKYVLGVGLHYYVDVFTSEETLDVLHRKYPNQEIIYTESSVNIMMSFLDENNTDATKVGYYPQKDQSRGGPQLGSWNRAAYYAQNIIENLNHWTTTYIDWNLGLNEGGGPNLGNFPCDASIIMNQTNKNEFYKQPIFYIMGHFSKFIQPDSVIIGVNFINTTQHQYSAVFPSISESTTTIHPYPTVPPFSNDVQYVGALNPDSSISIVFYNPKSTPAEIEVYDPEKGYAFLNLDAKSLSTIVYW